MGLYASAVTALAVAALLLAGCTGKAGQAAPQSPVPPLQARVQPPPTVDAPVGTSRIAEVIGESLEGREIEAVTLGTGPRTLVIIGGLHTGIEAETVDIAVALLDHFDEGEGQIPRGIRLVFIPNANPDGIALDQRANANGTDLNRNWPTEDWAPWAIHGESEVWAGDAPLSEPETTALYEYLLALEPDLVLTIHGYAGIVHHNSTEDAASLAGAFGAASGFEVIDEWTHYEVTGELIEALAEEGLAAADVELFEFDDQAFERVLRGVEAVLLQLAPRPSGP